MEKQTRTGNSDSLARRRLLGALRCHGNRQHQRRGLWLLLGI